MFKGEFIRTVIAVVLAQVLVGVLKKQFPTLPF